MRFLIGLFLFFPIYASSQQDPHFVSEGFTPFWTNPASAGSWNKFSANLVGRLQWIGVSGAPNSAMLTSEYSISLKNNQSLNTGFNFIAQEIGSGIEEYVQIASVPINYSFKLGETYLALGLAPGFRRINFALVGDVPPQTPNDSLIPPVSSSGSAFNLDAGIFWSSPRFYLGISSTQLTAPVYSAINFSAARHYYLQAGYRFKVGEHYIFPQLKIGADGAGVAFWNLNYFQFKDDVFSVGFGVSAGRDLLLAATYRYKRMKIAYNFDLNFGPLSTYTAGSHEVRLSYSIRK